MVTALRLAQSSSKVILSFVVPKVISRALPHLPSFSGLRNSKRGIIRPSVASATCCVQNIRPFHDKGEDTHLKAHSIDPPNGVQTALQQEVVGLIIEAPLANSEVGTAVLHPLHHVPEVFLLLVGEPHIGLFVLYIELVLGLRLGRFKWACKEAHLHIRKLFLHLLTNASQPLRAKKGKGKQAHLWVTELLDKKTVQELSVRELPALLGLEFDQLEINVLPLQIRHCQDSVHGNLCHLSLAFVNSV